MKTRLLERILVLSTILTLLLSPMVLAPSHPVFVGEEGETIDTILDNEWTDAGTTPDSFWWGLELWYEDNIEKPTPEEQLAERLAEAHVAMTAGDMEAAGEAMVEAQTEMTEVEAEVEAVEGDADNFEDYAEHTEEAITWGEQVDALTYEFEQAITTGAVPADSPAAEAVESSLDTLQDSAAAVGDAVSDLRDEIVDDLAADEGTTHIEAENTLESRETEVGIATALELAAQDELAEVREEVTALGEAIDTAQAAGEAVDTATIQLYHEATARLEHAAEAVEDGNFGEAYGQLTASEHITENAEDHLERQEEIPAELDPSTVREERLAEVQEFLEEAPPLLAANPELTDNVAVLQQELQVENRISTLLAERPAAEVYEEAAQELSHVYGRVDYIPPVFEQASGEAVSRLADFDTVAANLQTDGGFVEGFPYLDPATGYTYEFTEDGYRYTTPFGTIHEEDFPEGFNIPDSYSTGREEHAYTAPDGNTYTYTAAGYSLTKPDGTTESFAYDLGEYELPGEHGKLEVDPRGYTFFNERGREEGKLEYVPEFGTYISTVDGTTFNPEGIETIHDAAINYNYDTHNYVFDPEKATDFFSGQYLDYIESYANNRYVVDQYVPGQDDVVYGGVPGPGGFAGPGGIAYTPVSHDEWSYDPITSVWTNTETGEAHAAEATMVAPIGYEEEGSYSTATGETWTYDAETRGWTSDKGETFTSEGEGRVAGDYQDIGGHTYDYSHEGTYTDATTGVAWSYDTSTHGWTSVGESGVTGVEGGISEPGATPSIAPSTGTAVDQQGNVWSYDAATSMWSSPTYTAPEGQAAYGGYAVADGHTGTYSAPPAGTDTGGHTAGMEGGSYSGGSYSGDTGGSYSGGYSAPSGGDTGGSTGGSAPSGGDAGGAGGGDSGGGGGGGGDGGAGHVVREIRPAKELHPVTKFLLRYLGITE